MNLASISSRQSHRLLQVGIGLFLFSALIGLVVPHFTVPRIALAAHLIGILQGIFVVALGLLWPRLSLSVAMLTFAFWLLIYECVAAMATNLLAGAWGAGNSILPLAAGGAHGSAVQEVVIKIGLRSAGVALIAALVLILWGLRSVTIE
jgi:hydroxylaminobenzene mutase